MIKNKTNVIFFSAALLLVTLAFLKLVSIFILDVAVAAILTILFFPFYRMLCNKACKRSGVSALLTILLMVVSVVLPVFFIALSATMEVADFVWHIKNISDNNLISFDSLYSVPVLGKLIAKLPIANIQNIATDIGNAITRFMLDVTQKTVINASKLVFNFFMVLLISFFLFLDSEKLVRKIKKTFPFTESLEDVVFDRLKSVIDATIKGALIIAVLEGTVGGLLLFFFGMPSPVVLAMVMVIFSFIPVLGTNTVLVPVAIYNLFTGHIGAGITILVVGLSFVAFTQNILKPRLVGQKAGLHPMVILISTVGGLAWLGLVGFVIGPVIAALFLTLWDVFSLQFNED